MVRGRLNPRRAKIHRSYTVAEAATLFGAHRNTVRNWMKAGLSSVKTSGGALILGCELRAFLEKRQAVRRRTCGPGQLYCLKCREPRRPQSGSLVVSHITSTAADVRALCEDCGTRMHRRASLEKLASAGFSACPSRRADSHLADSPHPSLDCHRERTQ